MKQVITAARLRDGVVVFLDRDRRWVETIAEAEVFGTVETSTAALQSAAKDEFNNVVLEIYAIDVADKQGRIVPVRLREAIRAKGPTVHPEHGKAG